MATASLVTWPRTAPTVPLGQFAGRQAPVPASGDALADDLRTLELNHAGAVTQLGSGRGGPVVEAGCRPASPAAVSQPSCVVRLPGRPSRLPARPSIVSSLHGKPVPPVAPGGAAAG
jgi:hypothetical protein